jgi:hypothetical protein
MIYKNELEIHGVKIAPRAPEISHLFFADDSLSFCRATKDEVNVIATIIQTYERASGQLVNYNKSEMVTSKGVNNTTKIEITQILPMAIKDHFTIYLGMPTIAGRSKRQIFNFLQERIWKKTKRVEREKPIFCWKRYSDQGCGSSHPYICHE